MSDFDKNELKARVKHLTAKDPGSHAFVKATDVWLPPSECPEQMVRSLPLVCQLIRLPLRPGSRGVGVARAASVSRSPVPQASSVMCVACCLVGAALLLGVLTERQVKPSGEKSYLNIGFLFLGKQALHLVMHSFRIIGQS